MTNIKEVSELTNLNSDSLKVKVLNIEGTRYLDVRKYYLDGSRLRPTKKGVTINSEQFERLLKILTEKQGEIRKLLDGRA